MLTFEKIDEEAKAYSNLTDEQLQDMDSFELHEHLSLCTVAQEEIDISKKSFTQSANELLKRVKGDILCINREIRRRHSKQYEEREHEGEVITLEALPGPADVISFA